MCPGDQQYEPDRSCLLVGMDYGGSPHSCGYATIIVIYSDTSAFPVPGWYSGPVMYNTLLSNAGACQDLCSGTPGCDYFAYEWEETAGARHHECYLKQGYAYNECPHPVIEQYVPWANPSDAAWHGVSGPAVCVPPPPPSPPCIYASKDYGRSSSACGLEGLGYATTVALHYDNTLYDVPGWFSNPAILNPVLSSEAECQVLCAVHENCSYFSYECVTRSRSAGLWVGRVAAACCCCVLLVRGLCSHRRGRWIESACAGTS